MYVAPRPRTEVTQEHARSVISRNDSPDIDFTQALNPYRQMANIYFLQVVIDQTVQGDVIYMYPEGKVTTGANQSILGQRLIQQNGNLSLPSARMATLYIF